MSEDGQRGGLPRALKLGLGVLALGIATTVTIAIANLEGLRSAYQSTTATLSELQAVRAAIQTAYDAPNVSVVTGHVLTSSEEGRLSATMLNLEVVNPPFLEELPPGEFESKALEIAMLARESHPSPEIFDGYAVVLTRRTGFLFTIGTRRRFSFRPEDLSSGEPAGR